MLKVRLDSWIDFAHWREAGLLSTAAKRTLLTDLWDAVPAFRVDRQRLAAYRLLNIALSLGCG